jgi:hypothetical protein
MNTISTPACTRIATKKPFDVLTALPNSGSTLDENAVVCHWATPF